MDQKAINLNVQQRLRALEAQMQVLVPFCIALIETHPDRDRLRLRQRFAFHAETLKARALNSAIADDFLTELDRLRQVLDATFDLPNPSTLS